jgi:hypothetical protein
VVEYIEELALENHQNEKKSSFHRSRRTMVTRGWGEWQEGGDREKLINGY